MLKVDGHVIRKRGKLEFSTSTTRFFTNFWIFIPERHTNLIFSVQMTSQGEKKSKNLSSSNFFFRLVVSPDALKKNLAVKIFFPKNFDLIIVLQFWRFQVRFYWISTRDRLTFRHEGDKRQGTWLTTWRRDVTTWRTWRDNDVTTFACKCTHARACVRMHNACPMRHAHDDMHANYFSRHSTSPNHRACIPLLDSRRLRTRECRGVTVRSIQLRWYPFLIPCWELRI